MDHLRNLRILIVDDNESVHGDYKKILGGYHSSTELDDLESEIFGSSGHIETHDDFVLESAFQGEEALDKVRSAVETGRNYALAFVDMRMPPGWDGLRTIREIWAADPDILIVICTAYSDYSWDDVRRELGYTDQLLILKKPFETAEVYQLAVALTEKWRLARAANLRMDELEAMVRDRTSELVSVQQALSRAMGHLEILATTDGLTGLKNHRAFQEHLTMEWERFQRSGTSFAIVLMDIDGFKAYNDSFGHLAGDEVLTRVAGLLTDAGRKGDFIARHGGEEFVIVLHNADSLDAVGAAERFRVAIESEPWGLRPVTASFGCAAISPITENPSAFVHQADQALYSSKRRGRNCVTGWTSQVELSSVS